MDNSARLRASFTNTDSSDSTSSQNGNTSKGSGSGSSSSSSSVSDGTKSSNKNVDSSGSTSSETVNGDDQERRSEDAVRLIDMMDILKTNVDSVKNLSTRFEKMQKEIKKQAKAIKVIAGAIDDKSQSGDHVNESDSGSVQNDSDVEEHPHVVRPLIPQDSTNKNDAVDTTASFLQRPPVMQSTQHDISCVNQDNE